MESIQKSTAGCLRSFSLSFKTEGKEGLWREPAMLGSTEHPGCTHLRWDEPGCKGWRCNTKPSVPHGPRGHGDLLVRDHKYMVQFALGKTGSPVNISRVSHANSSHGPL